MIRKIIVLIFIISLLNEPINGVAKGNEEKVIVSIEQIRKEISNSSDVLIFSYKWSSLDYQLEENEEALEDLTTPNLILTEELPVEYDYFKAFYPDYDSLTSEEQEEIDELIETQIQINYSLNQLIGSSNIQAIAQRESIIDQIEEQRKQLRTAIKSIKVEKNITNLQKEEARESVKLLATKRYVNLLSLKKYIEIAEQKLVKQQEELERLNSFLKLKLVTKEDATIQEEKVDQQELALKQWRELYDLNLQGLLIDLGYDSSNDYGLEEIPEFEIIEPEMPGEEEATKYVENMYSLRVINEKIDRAKYQYDKETGNTRDQAYYNWKILKEEKNLLQKELKKKVYDKYQSFIEEYRAYQTQLKKVEKLQGERSYYKKQYDLGLISKYDLSNKERELDLAKKELEIKANNFYIYYQEEEALSKGILK